MTAITPIPMQPARRNPSASTGTDGPAGIGIDQLARISPVREITQDGGAWLQPHDLGGSAAFWTQLLGQLLPQENLLQPPVIQEMHASYARHSKPYGVETHVFFSPSGLDKDSSIDLYS
ncbi:MULTISPECIES: hypothetical protein [Thalassospira]|jgi:hypothetical protein|uniref:Uncharacterized protein n=1 Tax=Thalassospira povalilytica TaxID=732237 RepID=A0A8I1SJ05_9PROT|nr:MULTISPECIES: hypothetical protein [Thalassospira]MEE3046525.1 hypothetical protein [Pseudomonadota bacterium]RCK26817.1 hypothetical protein TH8_08945 [Thalassospira profundimaris]MAL40896.1 hypothetical protein [Thalassospira sp.]MBN8195926.1 hypothetical protein [Thalassospira povalilytica]MCC4241937.1 hypothetical protein [Thalassospira povalilytica]|tara:strand:+ start:134 stop:490 length:357 start_codon:yes stop_codon:yes gene_type:complete